MNQRVVVVGNGMVGHHFVTRLRALAPLARITVLGEEPSPAYDRVHLSELFAGKSADDLALATVAGYAQQGIDAHFGEAVVDVDTRARRVTLAGGRSIGYHVLVLATGSSPFVPAIDGRDHPRCLVYRTLADLERIRAAARASRTGVVVGGGLLGLECANALTNLHLDTQVVEFAPGLMGQQLDPAGSAMLRARIEALGVRVHADKATRRIAHTARSGAALTLRFADGGSLETDLVVFSAGIRPNDRLARDAGLALGPRGGIVVDQHCRTSADGIYAIGECALYEGRIFGLVAPGYRMAEAAAGHLVQAPAPFHGADMSTRLKLLGVDVGAVGDGHGNREGSLAYTYCDPRRQVYKRMNVSADGRTLLGAVLVGDCSNYDTLLQYHLNDLPLPDDPQALILPAVADAAGLAPAALPDTATICSCHNVCKGRITAAVNAGCLTLADVKAQTAAATGCGGCAPLLTTVVEAALAARGIETDTSLCEHFAHSRQELFHICRVERIDSFAELSSRHGRGRGCDVCKPAVASILATLWNGYLLSDDRAGLQDTNDRFLANLQKDGTYSVVPRVPGGEITPAKLMTLGRVAARYDLYTKITGGQRIDLFGARLEQLPSIWRELVAAGFETGHAYGKAMRTVKSCVGSTWCRYGVQDSVAMAIHLENRYKGLRAPHKIKLAVSGCARECAEAQSKDVGVIATERGWNLYVGGNGGMRPRHADLFATDLDDDTLVRYVDRFLMFYVRTADRLQRTAVWLEKLEGGLDYLREVIVDDSLGVAAELEAQMAAVMSTYQCEWRTTLADPERLKRFRPFVNSALPDDHPAFVRERGQKRPIRPDERNDRADQRPHRLVPVTETSP